jgi:hypothetical protein
VLGELSRGGDPLITVIGGAGIRLHTYLPTRTFELAVHGLDIARAVDISIALPADVLEEATALAAHIAAAEGNGETVLLALTGRDGCHLRSRSSEFTRLSVARGCMGGMAIEVHPSIPRTLSSAMAPLQLTSMSGF